MPRANREAQRAAERAAEERAEAERAESERVQAQRVAAERAAAASRASAAKAKPPKSHVRLRERAALSGGIRADGPRAARTSPTHQDDARPVPARSFSGRLVALAVVLAAVTIMLLPSVGVYMDQREELGELRASISELEQEQDDLQNLITRWEDPAYIRQQARERINLVMPGERQYMVIGEPEVEEELQQQNASSEDVRTDLPWVDALWDSVKRAATD
nr:septum formation initiator family protein [Zhihengliuella flava]